MNLYRNEAGQAVIEYILVLIVVVAVILGGLRQFNEAFRDWADNYFGEYLSCLLETGELPALGGAAGECNQVFEPFTLPNGRPPISTATAGGTAETGSAGSNPSTSNYNDQNANSGSSSVVQVLQAPTSFQGGSQSTRFRASPNFGNQNAGGDTGTAQITDLGSDGGGKVVRIPLKDTADGSRWARSSDDDDDKKEKLQVAGVIKDGNSENTNKLMRIERKISATEDPKIEEFTFGKFLRILLIAAIIIAIVFFVGSQLLQVSKSLD